MADTDERIECFIDVFNLPGQRALARKVISTAEMVQAIIDEFSGEIAYLGKNAASYQICQRDNGHPLDASRPLGEQVQTGSRLVLVEKTKRQPRESELLPNPFYLREMSHGYVYKIPWLPAIIGRSDPSMSENEMVAVDLQNLASGVRVSRRHLQMLVRDGVVYLELCSRNPATLIRASDGSKEELQEHRLLALHHGDTLKLERSDVMLQVIFQPEPEKS